MTNSLSNLANNLSDKIHRIKCKFGHDNKKCETCGVKYKYCDCSREYANFKDDLIEYKCSCCKKNYQHKFDEKLKERFFNTYKFSNRGNNNFILLLRKGVYSYEHVDWEKFNQTSLPKKRYFYGHLIMEDITDADYVHAKRVFNDLK